MCIHGVFIFSSRLFFFRFAALIKLTCFHYVSIFRNEFDIELRKHACLWHRPKDESFIDSRRNSDFYVNKALVAIALYFFRCCCSGSCSCYFCNSHSGCDCCCCWLIVLFFIDKRSTISQPIDWVDSKVWSFFKYNIFHSPYPHVSSVDCAAVDTLFILRIHIFFYFSSLFFMSSFFGWYFQFYLLFSAFHIYLRAYVFVRAQQNCAIFWIS